MNEKNFEYLRDQVKYTGFGETLEQALKAKLAQGAPEFQLPYQAQFGKEELQANLHFKKSTQSDLYFFNKYDLALKKDEQADPLKQTFYIGKDHNITLKEAYNLMSGRAVNKDLTNKEGQVYNAWLQLNFKETDKIGNYQLQQFHQNYGFDLTKELAKLQIKELANAAEKDALMQSLQKGNRQAVTFTKDGKEQRMFVEASPKFKSLNVYDSALQRIHVPSQMEKPAPKQSEGQTTTANQRQAATKKQSSAVQQKHGRKQGPALH